MKTILIFLITFVVFTPICLHAQTVEDVIYLKSGAIYRGSITGHLNGVYYELLLHDGHTIRIENDEVDKVTTERVTYEDDNKYGKRKSTSIGPGRGSLYLESTSSFVVSHLDIFGYGRPGYGGGMDLLAEIPKRGTFSVLTGAAANVISVRRYEYGNMNVTIDIDKGYAARVQVPVWLRWSVGQTDTKFLIQFGAALGIYYFQGWGYKDAYESYAPPVPGWQRRVVPSINIAPLGIGLRRQVWPNLQLITYIEGGPINLEINGSNPYRPYVGLHVGFNFDPTRSDTRNIY